jgi:twitching motility protein PilT
VKCFQERGNFGHGLAPDSEQIADSRTDRIPVSVKELLYKPRGLVLVTGPPGSGKTTTLASMINIINEIA